MNRSCMSLRLTDGRLEILDQTRLPKDEVWLVSENPEHTVEMIQRLAIRGAPLIGVSAALSLGLFASTNPKNKEGILKAAALLKAARPTAVNLMYAIDSCLQKYKDDGSEILKEAIRLFDEDVELCEGMARNGEDFISDGDGVLTHCNTGGLATVGCGTALGVIARAWKSGKKIHVYVDETRPLLQGSRLTAWELKKLGIPFTVISDNMAGFLMSQERIQKVFTGADRVAANGDSANKIGTYSVAVLAHYHKIPFYIVAPKSTFDPRCKSGAQIPIEIRSAKEVVSITGDETLPAYNPAFDVTPSNLISAIIFNDEVRKFQN